MEKAVNLEAIMISECMVIGTKVIETRLIPASSDILAITLFGLVFVGDRRRVDRYLLNHELIHCQQQLEWLYIPFFVIYGVEWLINMLRYRNSRKAYMAISFEREAYRHERDLGYVARRKHYGNYRK
ncbi:MAG: hypothetical protein PUD39_01650 [Bacteroidales bacterium]|nr:hypothetical protein [Bacteroidales bacterium]